MAVVHHTDAAISVPRMEELLGLPLSAEAEARQTG